MISRKELRQRRRRGIRKVEDFYHKISVCFVHSWYCDHEHDQLKEYFKTDNFNMFYLSSLFEQDVNLSKGYRNSVLVNLVNEVYLCTIAKNNHVQSFFRHVYLKNLKKLRKNNNCQLWKNSNQ